MSHAHAHAHDAKTVLVQTPKKRRRAEREKNGIPLSLWAVWDARAIAAEVAPMKFKSEANLKVKSEIKLSQDSSMVRHPPHTKPTVAVGTPTL